MGKRPIELAIVAKGKNVDWTTLEVKVLKRPSPRSGPDYFKKYNAEATSAEAVIVIADSVYNLAYLHEVKVFIADFENFKAPTADSPGITEILPPTYDTMIFFGTTGNFSSLYKELADGDVLKIKIRSDKKADLQIIKKPEKVTLP